MYKLLIADDEHLVIKSLKASINWNEYGFEVIGEAYDGVEAYELILKLKPDVAFVDIRMPGMNGLELIKKINEQSINTVFVVISGYAEFAYAQKAISYGALGFCLKPFEDSELQNILKKARLIIERRIENSKAELLALMGDHSPEGYKRKEEIIKSFGFDWNNGAGIIALISIGEVKLKIKSDLKYVCLRMGASRYAYLLNGDASDAVPESAAEAGLRGRGLYSIGISNPHYSPDSLETAIEEADIAAGQYFMTGKYGVYKYAPSDRGELASLSRLLEAAVSKRDIPMVKKVLEQFESLFSNGHYNVRHAFQVYNYIMYSFSTPKPDRRDDLILNYEQLTGSFKNISEMILFLKEVVMEYSGIKKDYANSEQRNNTFTNILNYVNENYLENISIHGIAQKFSVNANYVSQLFKREKGIAFTEYITNLRINYACTLLKTTNMPVTEVAEKTGFNDYYYFTRVFKKVTNKTPTAFRDES